MDDKLLREFISQYQKQLNEGPLDWLKRLGLSIAMVTALGTNQSSEAQPKPQQAQKEQLYWTLAKIKKLKLAVEAAERNAKLAEEELKRLPSNIYPLEGDEEKMVRHLKTKKDMKEVYRLRNILKANALKSSFKRRKIRTQNDPSLTIDPSEMGPQDNPGSFWYDCYKIWVNDTSGWGSGYTWVLNRSHAETKVILSKRLAAQLRQKYDFLMGKH